jgi:FkbM family methyltransferase
MLAHTVQAREGKQVMSAPPITRLKNRARDVVRRFIPARIRFQRAGRAFLIEGEREVHELPGLVKPDSVAIDVGTHIGDYTYSLCNCVGASGRVIAIEPIPDLARMLKRATRSLGLPVTVLSCALSAEAGEADLLIPSENGRGVTGYATLEPRARGGQTCHVPVRRLDDVCFELLGDTPRTVSFIKIDVEGHELKVLQGATQTIKHHRPNLLIEIEQRHSSVPIGQTLEFVTSLGYDGEFLDAAGNHLPLAAFSVDEHQTRQLDRIGQPGYVSNFIFRPR